MKSAKQILDIISSSNYQNASHPRFGKDVDKLYSKGYVKGYTWIDEMCSYYFNVEKGLIDEFRTHLLKKLKETQVLPESKYKQGLQESLQNALNSL